VVKWLIVNIQSSTFLLVIARSDSDVAIPKTEIASLCSQWHEVHRVLTSD